MWWYLYSPPIISSWNLQIVIVNKNRSVSNKQTLIWWKFLLVNDAWLFCYAEFCHATSLQMCNSWRVIGKEIFISTVNLRCFEFWMDQGILFEITQGFAKTNLIKNGPKKFKKFYSQYCSLFLKLYTLCTLFFNGYYLRTLFIVAILSQSNK